MPYPKIHIQDETGTPQDWSWIAANYGNVTLHRAEPAGAPAVIRLVGLLAKEGPASLVVKVLDPDGRPIEKLAVLRYWPGAPVLPAYAPPTSRWYEHALVGRTNLQGDCGFGLGLGDYYDPATGSGASSVWCAPPGAACDLVTGLGMLAATNHRHLDLVFQYEPAPDPDPDPDPEDTEETEYIADVQLTITGTVQLRKASHG